jgi:MraZ protein
MVDGSYTTRIDEKFRLKVPADFKREIDQTYGSQVFYITSTDGKEAQIYPLAEWRKVKEDWAEVPDFHPVKLKFFKTTSYYGQTVEMDSQGRLLLPQKLRESASLNEEVLVSGYPKYLAVENHATAKPEGLTTEDLMAAAELLKKK